MEEATTYKLGDISTMKYGKLPPKHINEGNYPIWSGYRYVGKCNEFNCNKGDIIIVARGVGGTGDVKIAKEDCYLTNLSIQVKLDKNICQPEYFYYSYLLSNLKYLDSGSAQSQITIDDLKRLEVTLPPLEQQHKITDILKSIDEKIELNRQINDNLEQQASSLLSDWISTYPCRTYKLSDICKYANAKCETGNLTPQNYISTENMLPNKKGIVEASNIPTGKATCYKVDDILIANIRPYFQKIWKADINGGCSADVLCIRANIESHSPILYWLLHQDAFFEYVMTGAKGCKMPRGDKQHIMNWSIDLPEVQYWADLATQLGSIDQQIAYNRIESINLSNLRDTLLPKLMSGELKINEIDC